MFPASVLAALAVLAPAPEPPDRAYVGPIAVAPTAEEPAADAEPASEAEEDQAPEDLSVDDIFGTDEDHEDIEEVPEVDESADAKRPKKALAEKLDSRWRIVTSAYLDVARTDEVGFGRQENRLEYYFAFTPNKHVQIVGDIEPVFFGVPQAQNLDDLATQQMLTPFHLESDAAYLAVLDLLPGLDLKFGRQTLVWGTADKFNPTNNINADDLEDRPLFTEPIGNQMLVVDYAPWGDKFWMQGVYVPVFYPALLPPSASAALRDPFSPVPYTEQGDLDTITELQDRLRGNDALIPTVNGHVVMPKTKLKNGQLAAKIGSTLGEVDLSASYYHGRHDIPTPVNVESSMIKSADDAVTPEEELYAGCCFVSDAFLVYPRMQVVGLDAAAQVPFLKNMGIWGEAAMIIPEPQTLRIEFPVQITVDGTPAFEMEGDTIRKTPFVKATGGLDYTFGKHVYVQGQYLRGFIDDFGVGHIGNYLVAGTDLIFFGRHLIFRLFGVVDLPTGRNDPGSYVVFPELIVVPPWGYLTFELGSFFLFSDIDVRDKYSEVLVDDTKFGQKAAGTSIVFLKVVGAF